MTPEEELKTLTELNKKVDKNVKHMANFVVGHPWMFSEWAVEESKKMLRELENH